jgi:predicted site-specific integrase-resolvase
MTTSPASSDALLSPGKAARKLAKAGFPTTVHAVRRWANEGKVWSTRTPSGRIMLRESDVDALIAQRSAP